MYLAVCKYNTVFSPSTVTKARAEHAFSAIPEDIKKPWPPHDLLQTSTRPVDISVMNAFRADD